MGPGRDALTGALARWLPGAVAHGVAAGIQLYVELPAGLDEAAVVDVPPSVGRPSSAALRVEHPGPRPSSWGSPACPSTASREASGLLAQAAATNAAAGPG